MPARIIPDVYTEVRAVGLATSLPFGLNTVGIIGTSEKGDIDTPTLLVSKQQMYDTFGEPGEYRSSSVTEGSERTLVRAGALAFDGGAPQIYFTRIASDNVAAATRYVTADDGTGTADGYSAGLEALSEGTWGNNLRYKVEVADGATTTEGHVASVGATVENTFLAGAADPGEYEFDTYDGQITPWATGTQFTYLTIPSADSFPAVASPSTRVELQRNSADNYQRTLFTVIHTDASYLKASGDVTTTEVLDLTGEKYSQSFWTIDGFNMTGAILRLKTDGTGNVTLKLFLADDNNEPTGSELATSASVDVTTFTGSFAHEEIPFTAAYDVLPMTNYCLVLEGTTITTNTVTWAGGGNGSSSDEYTQGVGKHYTASWAVLTNASDLLFQPTYSIPENWCILIMNDWGADATGVFGTYTKKIIWSEASGNAPTVTGLPGTCDTLYLTYETASSIKFTLNYNQTSEVYYVVDGYDLIQDINDTDDGSNLISAAESAYGSNDNPEYYPLLTTAWQYFGVGAGASTGTATLGNDGSDVGSGDYTTGIATLESVDAHIILAAGQYSPVVHAALQAHCDNMSTQKKERVAVAGHRYGQTLSQVMSSNLAFSSKRAIFVSPGITTSNHETGGDETVSASYTASLMAGYMASVNPSFSPLGKGVPVGELETAYNNAELEQLIKRKIDPIRVIPTGGFKWAYAATASLDSSWHEITTVRITDYATTGIRSACESFIGKKNIAQERNSIFSAVTGFMRTMVADQMLIAQNPFSVSVTATRDEQTAGIVRVDVSFKPVFAIKYILVTEYVE